MVDPAIKEKAKELYVVNGFSMETILTMLEGGIAKKTLYNIRNKEDWDSQRRERSQRVSGRRERLEALIDHALDELDVNFDPKLIFSIGKLVAALKSANTFEFTEEKKEKENNREKGFTEETLRQIEQKVLNL